MPDKPYTSRNGFSRIVKSKQVYRLQMILDPTGDGDSNDEDQFMPTRYDSTDLFRLTVGWPVVAGNTLNY